MLFGDLLRRGIKGIHGDIGRLGLKVGVEYRASTRLQLYEEVVLLFSNFGKVMGAEKLDEE